MASPHVVDTNALIWYLTDSPRLSATARTLLQRIEGNGDSLLIPTIVLAELLGLARKGKVPWPETLAALFEIDASRNWAVIPFAWEDVRLITGWPYTCTLEASDLHDLIILAAAERSRAKLITADRELREQSLVETVW